jgi:sigma-B regulation protein RsbU (phosphoserine phosphatase)
VNAAAPPPIADEPTTEGYFELLADLLEEFAQSKDVGLTTERALGRIAQAMNAESASLFLLEGEYEDPESRLVCRAAFGPNPMMGLTINAHSGIAGRALARKLPQLVEDAARDPDFRSPRSLGVNYEIHTMLCAPLCVRERRLGAVQIINRRGSRHLFDQRDAEALSALAASTALAIHNALLTHESLEQARLRQELELAGAVQRNLLPQELPADSPVHGLNWPARGVSGDFYDILPLPQGRIAFALADVSGKGMNAALIMVKCATLFRSFGKRIHEPGLLLGRIEQELCETLSFGMFVTMVVGVYDPRTHEVQLANAGHLPPLLRGRDGRFHELPAEDPPLGIQCRLERNRYRQTRVALGGGSLYLYTDGATETRRADGRMVGVEGLQALIDHHRKSGAGERLRAIAAELRGLETEPHDDLTLLVVEDRQPVVALRPRRRRSQALLVSQTIPAQAAQLKVVRRLVEAAARRAGAGCEWAQELVLAVDEACQNIIRHGYGNCGQGKIRLAIRRRGCALEVELVDDAPAVKDRDCRGRRLDELKPGGLGTHFMHALTDRVRRLPPPPGAGNRLLMVKKFCEDEATGQEGGQEEAGQGAAAQ